MCAASATQSAATARRPLALPKGHPWPLDWVPGEVCVAEVTPIRSFFRLSPEVPPMQRALHLSLTLGLPLFLPHKEVKIPGAAGQSGAQAVLRSQ